MLLCNCGNKVFTDGKDIKLAAIPTAGIPKRADGKDASATNQKKKFKCDRCGYILNIIKLAKEEDKNGN